MKALNLKVASLWAMLLIPFALMGLAFSSQQNIKRLDLYDVKNGSPNNHLMYVTFSYDGNGRDTGYEVYFSDGTFARRVHVDQDAQGVRLKEAALNFTDDTVFQSTFTDDGTNTSLKVVDQFGINAFGVPISYNSAGPMDFNVVQSGATINKISYTYVEGKMKSINIYDKDNILAYMGVVDSGGVGVLSPKLNTLAMRPSLYLRGDNVLVWSFSLEHASNVKCEVMSLLGRRMAVLFSGDMPIGNHYKAIHVGSASSLTNGGYVAVMSIDGKQAARSKFIIQRSRGGVR
jgi:hypothetical protein